MGPTGGPRGPERAASFPRVLADLARKPALQAALDGRVSPAVTPEQPVKSLGARGRELGSLLAIGARPSHQFVLRVALRARRQQAVVVVEAKLGATVACRPLLPYGREAARRARGGLVMRVLLTVRADAAERRYRSWAAVRWFALMRRWEGALAAAGDVGPEFAAVRAHIWRFLLDGRGCLQ